MVQFKAGDQVVLCASIDDFCGQVGNNAYQVKDINISTAPCNITTFTSECLNFSGLNISFAWTSSTSSPGLNSCPNIIKVLGTATTNSQGIASLPYTIDVDDLNRYNANTPNFDLMACINNSPIIYDNEVRNSVRPGDLITIVQDKCLGVLCGIKCFGTDLSSTKCDISTGNCIQDIIIQPNSPLCLSTHVLSYNLNFLPTSFLDLIGPNIVTINNTIANYLIMPTGVEYIGSNYFNGTFQVYIKQTLSLLSIPQTIVNFAAIVGAVLVFIIGAAIVVVGGTAGLIIGPIVAAFAAYALSYVIADMTGELSNGSTIGLNNTQLTDAGNNFMQGTLAGIVTVGCSDLTLTQDQRALCIKNNTDNLLTNWKDYITNLYPNADHAPLSEGISNIQICYDIYNGSSRTPQNYQDLITCFQLKSTEALDKDKGNVLTVYPPNAPAGSQTVPGSTTCQISLPIVGCIDTALIVGSVLIGGYILFRLIKK